MIGTIQEIGSSQSGRPKLKIDGKYYSAKQELVGGLSVGQRVEFNSSPYQWNGKTYHSIESIRPASNGNGHAAQPSGVDDAAMRFISNCVGSAITAKTITEPGQINAWFQAAKAALSGKAADIPFDDAVGGGPDW